MVRTFFLLSLFCLSRTFAQVGAQFEIRNEHLKEGFYSFDVFMSADTAGTFHTRGQVYISYNPEMFGPDVVKNGVVTAESGDLLREAFASSPKYSTINLTDNGNRMVLTWQSNFLMLPAEPKFHTAMPFTMASLYHIKLKVQNPQAAALLDFDRKLMEGQQFYFWEGEKRELPYRSGALPEEALILKAEKANHHDIRLSWTTAAEYNSSHFLLEKRRGDDTFEQVARIAAAGNSLTPRTYTYLDQSGMANTNSYRIRQVDKNGSSAYSEVVEVRFNYFKNDKFVVSLDAGRRMLVLQATGPLDGDYPFVITDLNGKVHYRGIIPAEAPRSRLRIDVSNLTEATHYVTFTSPAGKNYLSRFSRLPD